MQLNHVPVFVFSCLSSQVVRSRDSVLECTENVLLWLFLFCFIIELVCIYCRFKHRSPEDATEVPGGFLSDCNMVSVRVLSDIAVRSLDSC